jgi:hypothetical protein
MEVPAIHQGRERPVRKYSSVEEPERRAKRYPTARAAIR